MILFFYADEDDEEEEEEAAKKNKTFWHSSSCLSYSTGCRYCLCILSWIDEAFNNDFTIACWKVDKRLKGVISMGF